MYRLILIIGIFFLTGCAFKEPVPQTETPKVQGDFHAAVDWSNEPQWQFDQKFRALRSLEKQGDSFKAAVPVTLPVSVPANLYLGVEHDLEFDQDNIEFSRAKIKIGEEEFRVNADVIQAKTVDPKKKRVIYRVFDLKPVYGKEHSQLGTLTLESYQGGKKVLETSLLLRTPPSHLNIENLSLADFSRGDEPSKSAYYQLEIQDTRLNLIRSVHLENNEELPVEIQFPRRPGATVTQFENHITYRDIECGYGLDENSHYEQLATDILFLPMTSQILLSAKELLNSPQMQDRGSLIIQSGQSIEIGVYAIGSKVDGWVRTGTKTTSLQKITVPNDCYQECRHWKEHKRPGDMAGIQICTRWVTLRRSAQITVGVERGSLQLVMPSDQLWTARHGDLTLEEDGEIRTIFVFSGVSEVPWF